MMDHYSKVFLFSYSRPIIHSFNEQISHGEGVTDLPLKEEEVEVVVVLGKKIPKNTVWVATFDLVG